MRAGPLSDESVANLLNRRFIPYHFDLSPRGYLGDEEANTYLKEKLPEFIGRGGVSTPPIVFMTPEGKIVGQVSNYASTETLLKTAFDTLEKLPEFNKLSAAEEKLTGLAKSKLLLDLGDLDGAAKVLENDDTDEATYMKGRIARLQGKTKAAEEFLANVKKKELQDDVRMERALLHWAAKDYAKLIKAVSDFPVESNRRTEAAYFHGLGLFHLDKKKEACDVWRELITSSEEDRWIYRADWAYYDTGVDGKRNSSLLGRIGYMGTKHPDLQIGK